MLDISKLSPAQEDHSISEAVFILLLPTPIVNAKSFEKLLVQGGALHTKFQRFTMNMGLNLDLKDVNIEGSAPDVLPKVSKFEQKGFNMEAFVDGKLDWLIRYNPGLVYGAL